MNDTDDIYLDPDEQRRLQNADQDVTLPPPPRPMATETSVRYRPEALPAVPPEPEHIPTPRSFPPTVPMIEPPPPRRASSGLSGCLTGLALVLALVSILLNVMLLVPLLSARQAALENVDAAIRGLDDLSGKGFHYEYELNREIPVSADVPIQQQMTIPFAGDFPINTTIEVPIDAGLLGTFVVDVPINTSVYVETEVPVNIDQTFHFSTSIPISMTVPIDVATDDPEVQSMIDRVEQWLTDLREALRRGFLPSWVPIGQE